MDILWNMKSRNRVFIQNKNVHQYGSIKHLSDSC